MTKRYSITHRIVSIPHSPPEWALTVRDELEAIDLETFCDRKYYNAHNQAVCFILDMKENDWSHERWN